MAHLSKVSISMRDDYLPNASGLSNKPQHQRESEDGIQHGSEDQNDLVDRKGHARRTPRSSEVERQVCKIPDDGETIRDWHVTTKERKVVPQLT